MDRGIIFDGYNAAPPLSREGRDEVKKEVLS